MGEQHSSDEARDDEFDSSAARRSSGAVPSPAASPSDRSDANPQSAEHTSPSDVGSFSTNPSDINFDNSAAVPAAPLRAAGANTDHAAGEWPSQLRHAPELGRTDESLLSREGLPREETQREDVECEGLQPALTAEPARDRFDEQVRAALEQVEVPVGLAALIQLRLSAAEREYLAEDRIGPPVPGADLTQSGSFVPGAGTRSGPPVPGADLAQSGSSLPSAGARSGPPVPGAELAHSGSSLPGAGTRSGPPVPGARTRRWWWLAAAAVVLAVVAPRLWLSQPLQLDALAVVDESLTWVGKLSRLQTWQSYEGERSSPYPVTRLVAGVVQRFSSWPTKWDPDARVYEYRSQAAQPSYCFVVHFDRKLEGPGYLPPRTPLRAGSGWSGACWQEGAYLYIVVVPGGERDYLQAVEAGRQLAVNSPSPASFAKL